MSADRLSEDGRAAHWDSAYRTRGIEEVSWYQAMPATSLHFIDGLEIPPGAAVVDIGGSASVLVDHLIARGFEDVSVLDISEAALEVAKGRIGADPRVSWLRQDLLEWSPTRRFDLWHDRAVFHFMVEDADRERYLSTLRSAINPGGAVIIATFAADGPDRCSGLLVARYSGADLAA